MINIKKNAQIATGLTWVSAFPLIVFFLITFLAITFTVNAAKSLTVTDVFTDYGKNEISLSGTQTRSIDYLTSNEIISLIGQEADYKGNPVRIIDIFRQYSQYGQESDFDIIRSNLKNRLDVLYEECYSLCLVSQNNVKQIIGSRCTDLFYSCTNENDPYLTRNYQLGKFVDNTQRYEIKLYTKQNG